MSTPAELAVPLNQPVNLYIHNGGMRYVIVIAEERGFLICQEPYFISVLGRESAPRFEIARRDVRSFAVDEGDDGK